MFQEQPALWQETRTDGQGCREVPSQVRMALTSCLCPSGVRSSFMICSSPATSRLVEAVSWPDKLLIKFVVRADSAAILLSISAFALVRCVSRLVNLAFTLLSMVLV